MRACGTKGPKNINSCLRCLQVALGLLPARLLLGRLPPNPYQPGVCVPGLWWFRCVPAGPTRVQKRWRQYEIRLPVLCEPVLMIIHFLSEAGTPRCVPLCVWFGCIYMCVCVCMPCVGSFCSLCFFSRAAEVGCAVKLAKVHPFAPGLTRTLCRASPPLSQCLLRQGQYTLQK